MKYFQIIFKQIFVTSYPEWKPWNNLLLKSKYFDSKLKLLHGLIFSSKRADMTGLFFNAHEKKNMKWKIKWTKLNERRKKKAFKTFMKMAILCLQELQEEEQIWKKVVKKLNFTEIDNFILLEQLVTDNFPKYNCSRKLVSFSVLRNSYKVLAEQFKVLVALQL